MRFIVLILLSVWTLSIVFSDEPEFIRLNFGERYVSSYELDSDKIYIIEISNLPTRLYNVSIKIDDMKVEKDLSIISDIGKSKTDLFSVGLSLELKEKQFLDGQISLKELERLKSNDKLSSEYGRLINSYVSVMQDFDQLIKNYTEYRLDAETVLLKPLADQNMSMKFVAKMKNRYLEMKKKFNKVNTERNSIYNELKDNDLTDTNKAKESEYKSILNVFEEHNSLVNRLEEHLDFGKNTEMFDELLLSIYEEPMIYTSMPFKTGSGKGKVEISIIPVASQEGLSSYTTVLSYPEYESIVFLGGVQSYTTSRSYDEYYVSETNTILSETVGSGVGIGVYLMPTWKIFEYFGLGLNMGIGTSFDDTDKIEGLLGVGLTIGKDYYMTIGFGSVFRQFDTLRDDIDRLDTANDSAEDFLRSGVGTGTYFSVGFALPL